MNIAFTLRIGLCILSGIGVGMMQISGLFDLNTGLVLYPASGLLFTAGVLFPYLERDDHVYLRVFALVVASTASYYSAVWLALEAPFSGDDWISFTIASVVGAAVVIAAFVIATPTRVSRSLVLYGLAAGLIGGPVTAFTLPSFDRTLPILSGHAMWHTLIFLAIYLGTKASRS